MQIYKLRQARYLGENLKAVEICANCGQLRKKPKETFVCENCKCEVAVVVPYPMFRKMVEAGMAKE